MSSSHATWTFDEPCKRMEWNELSTTTLEIQADGTVDKLGTSDLVLLYMQAPATDDDNDDEEKEESEDVPSFELSGLLKVLDESNSGAFKSLIEENHKEFKLGAKLGGTTPTLRLTNGRYICMGLGAAPKPDTKDDPYDDAGGALGKAVASKCDAEKRVKTCTIVVPSDMAKNDKFLKDFSTAFFASLYSDNRFRSGPRVIKLAGDLQTVTILSEGAISGEAQNAIEFGKKLASGVFLARDIVNSPHNVLNSLGLADTARRIAESSGGSVSCTILGKDECEKLGMGAYLGVARGSETPPQFIHLTYKPTGEIRKKIGIVGKGLLFDTGGYNIKVAMMELMKFDCGGGAAVLGAARAVSLLKPPGVEAHFIVAACENMINDKAYVPSDILTASNGKTIEVMNTDAEGRLTLADALVYADKTAGCEEIIELSTLTGACMVAMGKKIGALFTHNDDLAKELEQVSKVSGDKMWRMPMEKAYNEQLNSKIADLNNLGDRFGSAITAALFLQHFVNKKKPFAHLDIAGPVWDWSGGVATGFGAKLVTEWVLQKGVAPSS